MYYLKYRKKKKNIYRQNGSKPSENVTLFRVKDKKLTSDEFLKLNDRHIDLQAGEAEELPPWDAHLMDV